jgi:chemotaxis protein histidine kinase CheA
MFKFLILSTLFSLPLLLVPTETEVSYPSVADGYAANQPFAWWRLTDETGSKTAADVMGHQHGTYNMPHGSFDGKHGYVDVGAVELTTKEMTILAWFRAKDFETTDARIISMAKGVNNEDHFWMLSTFKQDNQMRLRFRLRTQKSTTELVANRGELKSDEWVFAACVFDGKQMRIYQNGELVAEAAKQGKIDTNKHIHTWIGDNPADVGSRPFNGEIANVAIFKHALSEQQVKAVFAAAKNQGNLQELVAANEKQALAQKQAEAAIAEKQRAEKKLAERERQAKADAEKRLAEIKTLKSEADKLKSQLAEFEQKANKAAAEISELQKSAEVKDASLEKITKAQADLQKRFRRQQANNKKLQMETEETSTQLANTEAEMKKTQQSLNQSRKQAEQAQVEHQQAIQELKNASLALGDAAPVTIEDIVETLLALEEFDARMVNEHEGTNPIGNHQGLLLVLKNGELRHGEPAPAEYLPNHAPQSDWIDLPDYRVNSSATSQSNPPLLCPPSDVPSRSCIPLLAPLKHVLPKK